MTKPEELLAHGGFVQSLARKLIRDEHLAADAVQQKEIRRRVV